MQLTIIIDHINITYKLNDNPVTKKFIEIADHMKGQPIPDWTTWWRPNLGELSMEEEWNKLIVFANKCGLPISNQYDAKVLNDLHRDFHANVEPSNSVMEDMAAVNTQIHLVESVAHIQSAPSYRWTPKFGAYQYNKNMHYQIPLEDSDYQYFKESEYSKLMMGYNTVGKNIGHCAMDNDIDTVKQYMVRPQLHASCEIIANLNKPSWVSNNYNPDPFNSVGKTEEWIERNNLHSYIDMSLPCNKTGAMTAEIGDLETPLSDEDLSYIFKKQSITEIIRN